LDFWPDRSLGSIFELHGTIRKEKQTNAQDGIRTLRELGFTGYDIERDHDIGQHEAVTGIENRVSGHFRA